MSVLITEQVVTDLLTVKGAQALCFEGTEPLAFNSSFKDLLHTVNNAQFWAVEVCNRAMYRLQLDACINPWLVLQEVITSLPNATKLLSFQGQFLFGDRQFADDVVHKFVAMAVQAGVDVFRIGDPLNDLHNLRTSIQSIKAHKKHAQVSIVYTKQPIEYFHNLIKQLTYMNVDSICIVNNGQQLLPYQAFELISELKTLTSLPLHVHAGRVSSASMSAIKAIEAGVDGVVSQQLTASHSQYGLSIAALMEVFQGSNREPKLRAQVSGELIQRCGVFLSQLSTPGTLNDSHLSLFEFDERTLINELAHKARTRHSLELSTQRIVDEILAIQRDLGGIPLCAPVSFAVIEQAFSHLLNNRRYILLTPGFSQLCAGNFGLMPGNMDDVIHEFVIQRLSQSTHRKADDLEDEYHFLEQGFRSLLDNTRVSDKFVNFKQHIEFDSYVFNYAFHNPKQGGMIKLLTQGPSLSAVPTSVHTSPAPMPRVQPVARPAPVMTRPIEPAPKPAPVAPSMPTPSPAPPQVAQVVQSAQPQPLPQQCAPAQPVASTQKPQAPISSPVRTPTLTPARTVASSQQSLPLEVSAQKPVQAGTPAVSGSVRQSSEAAAQTRPRVVIRSESPAVEVAPTKASQPTPSPRPAKQEFKPAFEDGSLDEVEHQGIVVKRETQPQSVSKSSAKKKGFSALNPFKKGASKQKIQPKPTGLEKYTSQQVKIKPASPQRVANPRPVPVFDDGAESRRDLDRALGKQRKPFDSQSPVTPPLKSQPQSTVQRFYEFCSPLVGTVLKIHVAEKGTFKEGDRLVSMDVMRMKVDVFAEADGMIEKYLIREQQQVELNQALFSLGSVS
ncbi:MAG: biotin/lipoyl-containing protein [Pseudomonadota bacterium]